MPQEAMLINKINFRQIKRIHQGKKKMRINGAWHHFYWPNRIEARKKKLQTDPPKNNTPVDNFPVRGAEPGDSSQDKNPKKADKVVYIHPLTNP